MATVAVAVAAGHDGRYAAGQRPVRLVGHLRNVVQRLAAVVAHARVLVGEGGEDGLEQVGQMRGDVLAHADGGAGGVGVVLMWASALFALAWLMMVALL